MQEKNRILVIYIEKSSFVQQDIDALKTQSTVTEYSYGSRKGFSQLIAQLKLFLYLISHRSEFDSIYCWFADYHCLIPSLIKEWFCKKLIIAIGGFDAIAMPEFGYGAHVNKLRSGIIKLGCKKADLLICSSKFVGDCLVNTLSNPSLLGKILVAYPGIDCKNYPLQYPSKEYEAIYVSAGNSINRMMIKGVDRYLEMVMALPEKRFILIGPELEAKKWIESFNLTNLELMPAITRSQLAHYYFSSKYVMLLSRFEAFGMVILEGMCCGCIPITISTLGTAEILKYPGAPGFILNEFNFKQVHKILYEGHSEIKELPMSNIETIRTYLNTNFPVDVRARKIIETIAN